MRRDVKCSGTVTGVLPVNRAGMQPASLSVSAPDFFRKKPHGTGWFPHWYGSTVTTARVTCQVSPAGKITDGKPGGSTGWTGTAVTAVTASGTGLGYGEGDESYGYDSCGYLKAQSAGRHRISEETDQYAGGHRLKQAGNTQYDYDAAGRMVSRTRHRDGYRPETERFRWDSRDQLTGYCSAQGEQWEYRHDASGRRTEKRCDRKKIRFTYLWDGDSIAEIREYRDDKLYSVRHRCLTALS